MARLVLLGLTAIPSPALAAQELVDPSVGTLELVTPTPAQQAKLVRIDGLEFDEFGNLFGVLEIDSSAGGLVHVDKASGEVTTLLTGIRNADQIELHPSGDFFVTSEVKPESTTDRLYRVTVAYEPGNVPLASGTTASSVTTSLALNNPEGLVVLENTGPFGETGDLYVNEDVAGGRILHVRPATGQATFLAGGFARPEGMAFGDFGGALPPALYFAETDLNRVVQLDSSGNSSVFGDPTTVSLQDPDNVRFGPDGFLYVSEDRDQPEARVLRVASDGTYSEFARGFGSVQGMIFDPANGDMYIAEQDLQRIWRVRFSTQETYLVVGTSPMSGTFAGENHTWPTQVSGITSSFEVSSGPDPSFAFPDLPTGTYFRYTPVPVGELYVQVLLWDPGQFPGNPEQWSKGMRVTLWSHGRVTVSRYGTRDGISIGARVTRQNRKSFVSFPFTLLGDD